MAAYRPDYTHTTPSGVRMYRVRQRGGPSVSAGGRKSWPLAQAEAIASRMNVLRERAAEGGELAPLDVTVTEALERYLDEVERHDMAACRSRVRVIAGHRIGSMRLRRLDQPADVARFRKWLLTFGRNGRPYSPETARKFLSLLSAMLQHAIEHGYGPRSNPVRDVRLPKRQRKPPPKVLAVELWGRLERLPERSRELVLLLLWTGLRPGELEGLLLSEVVDDGGAWARLDVRTGTRGRRRAGTKTGGRREVYVWGRGLKALRTWLRDHRPRLKRRTRGTQRAFPVCLRRYLTGDMWKRAELRPYTPTDLRHTHATGLAFGWFGERWTARDAAQRMGHSVQTMEAFYVNATGGPAKAAALAAAEAWAESGANSADRPRVDAGENALHEGGLGCAGETANSVGLTRASALGAAQEGDRLEHPRVPKPSQPAPADNADAAPLLVQNPWEILGRARCDSNARPLASEANAPGENREQLRELAAHVARFGADVGTVWAAELLTAAADGDTERVQRLGVALADELLRACAKGETG